MWARTEAPHLGFLDLSADIRMMVYRHINHDVRRSTGKLLGYHSEGMLVPCLVILGGSRPVVIDPRPNALLTLSRTCRRLYQECIALAYNTTVFEFQIHDRTYLLDDEHYVDIGEKNWKQLRGMIRLDLVRHISVRAPRTADEWWNMAMANLLGALDYGDKLVSFVYDVYDMQDENYGCAYESFWTGITTLSPIHIRGSDYGYAREVAWRIRALEDEHWDLIRDEPRRTDRLRALRGPPDFRVPYQ